MCVLTLPHAQLRTHTEKPRLSEVTLKQAKKYKRQFLLAKKRIFKDKLLIEKYAALA